MTIPYTKIPLSAENQLALLKLRGLIIDDESKAVAYLQGISYYRLSAYFLPYQSVKDTFENNITFEQIIKTYLFDRELRLLVFDFIGRIEIAVRTQFIYQMALYHNDSHWQDNKNHFAKPYPKKNGDLVDTYANFQTIILKARNARTPEAFIGHYLKNYGEPPNPPSWMCFELLTIGELSHIYKGLKDNADKKRVADFFDVSHTTFASWLHTLAYVRNICAHHSRLWNRDLAIEPKKILKPRGSWIDESFENNKRVFYFLCTLRYLLLRVNPQNSMTQKIENLFDKYPTVPIKFLGIPSDGEGNLLDWKSEPLWK